MSKYTITHSTELMQNYLQATAMAPEKDFRALQKSDGGALLFSIGSDDSFNVTAESPGRSHAWNPPMSLSQDYPGSPCRHFAVAQRADGSIQMAMVLRETKNNISNDQLYLGHLSLSQSGEVKPPPMDRLPVRRSQDFAAEGGDRRHPDQRSDGRGVRRRGRGP